MKRPPVLATLVVLAAVALMVALGIWQLHRLRWKEGLIARYQSAMAQPELDWRTGVPLGAAGAYRRVRLTCERFDGERLVGGRNAQGQSGWAHWTTCIAPSGSVTVVAGWSHDLSPCALAPSVVSGVALGGADGEDLRIVANPPLGRLAANAEPDPRDLPNNHFSYAVQWFLFAGTALVIFGIAVWKKGGRE